MVHNLVNAVKGVLFVNDGIEEDTKSPDVLLFAAVGLAGENFGGSVIYATEVVSYCSVE